MNKENDPLDELFASAKQQQESIAATVETGVETRLRGNLKNNESDLWYGALWRLCSAGGLAAACLGIWVILPQSGTTEITAMVIEQWMLGM